MATKASRLALSSSNIDATGTVDSGTVDGLDSPQFLRSDANDSTTGNLGIGVSSPFADLTVGTSTTFNNGDNYITAVFQPAINGGESAGMLFGHYPASGYAKQGIFWERYTGSTGSGGRGKLHFVNRDANDTSVPTTADTRMTILESGNVGIGTQSPTHMLEIKSSGNAGQDFIKVLDSDSNQQFRVYSDSSTGEPVLRLYDTSGSAKIVLHANGVSRFEGGNVGIGTTNPDKTLTVRGTSGDIVQAKIIYAGADGNRSGLILQNTHTGGREYGLYVGNNSTGAGLGNSFGISDNTAGTAYRLIIDAAGRVAIGRSSSYQSAKVTIENNAHGNYLYMGGSTENNRGLLFTSSVGSSGAAYLGAKHTILAQSGGGEIQIKNDGYTWLFLGPTGNVGVGTTNPLGKLHVGFSGRAGVFIGSTNGGGSYLLLDGAGNGDGSGSDYAYLEHQSSGNLAFNVGNSSNTVGERMTILPGGYVGINTTNPQRALHIHDHSATGLHITNTQSGSGANDGFSQYIRDDNQATELMVRENSYLGFGTNNTLRAKILSSGEMFWPEISNRGDLTFPICSISNAGSGGQYLHAQFQSYGGAMLHIHFRGYEYIGSSVREGTGGGYVYNTSGQQVIYAQAYSGHCVQVYQTTTNRVELVINTGSGATGNRWGSYVFFGGTDTITGDTPLTLVQYGWNSSTGRLYSS